MRYVIQLAVLAAAALVFARPAQSETFVSGEIATTTWTKANSPYHLTDTLRVPAGETLTIEAGVEVVCDSAAIVLVEGRVLALGTEADTVRFHSPPRQEWRGIRIVGADSSVFEHVLISNGGLGGGGALSARGMGVTLRLNNCVVQSAYAGPGPAIQPAGGGIVLEDSAVGTFHGCTIRWNASAGVGGGLAVLGSASATIESSTFSHNMAYGSDQFAYLDANVGGGGTFVGSSAHLTARECEFVENRADFGTGGAIFVADGGNAVLEDCVLSENLTTYWGGGGGIAVTDAFLRLTRSIVVGNSAGMDIGDAIAGELGGGAAYLRGNAALELVHCTVAGNSAHAAWPANIVAEDSSDLSIVNSIIVGNGQPWSAAIALNGIYDWHNDPVISVRYSVVFGDTVWSGPGNLDADPLLRSPGSGDVSLLSGSPCIDAGDPDSPADPDGSRADIGALPFDRVNPVRARPRGADALSLGPAIPNPSNGAVSIPCDLPAVTDVSLRVYNAAGQVVRTLVDTDEHLAGAYTVTWNSTDAAGREVATGVYLVRLTTPTQTVTQRITLLR